MSASGHSDGKGFCRKMTIKISGTGSALPEKRLTNKELEQMVDTSDAWIRERTGIQERHIAEGDSVVSLAAKACQRASSTVCSFIGTRDLVQEHVAYRI